MANSMNKDVREMSLEFPDSFFVWHAGSFEVQNMPDYDAAIDAVRRVCISLFEAGKNPHVFIIRDGVELSRVLPKEMMEKMADACSNCGDRKVDGERYSLETPEGVTMTFCKLGCLNSWVQESLDYVYEEDYKEGIKP
jgi:hypothetical protein